MARRKPAINLKFVFLLILILMGSVLVLRQTIKNNVCANTLSCEESLSLNIDNEEEGIFGGQKVTPPRISLSFEEPLAGVLGEETGKGVKHIYVDLTTQTLTAYEGDNIFLKTSVSTGKWFPTPTGEFKIWEKLKATKMSGGEGNDYYYLPNVPFVMFFEGSGIAAGRGFALHGTYWHNNFGHPMSHGCVNMRTIDAEKLYYWVNPPTVGNVSVAGKDNPGTKITIYGEAPR